MLFWWIITILWIWWMLNNSISLGSFIALIDLISVLLNNRFPHQEILIWEFLIIHFWPQNLFLNQVLCKVFFLILLFIGNSVPLLTFNVCCFWFFHLILCLLDLPGSFNNNTDYKFEILKEDASIDVTVVLKFWRAWQ